MEKMTKKITEQKNNTVRGMLCIICSAFCFAAMNLFVRLSGDLPSIEKSFFRNVVAALIAAAMLMKKGGGFMWKRGSLPGLLLRSFFGTCGILCNFYAVDHLVLSDASMLNKMSPFFAIIFSFIILKERITLFGGVAVAAAFIGSLFIIKPTSALLNPAGIVGLCGGLGAGVAYTMVRYLTEHGERKEYIVFFFSAFSCIVTLPYLIFNFHPMDARQLVMLLFAGASAAGGQFGVTSAYAYAPARDISVFDYTQIVFAALMGFFVLGQVPDAWSIFGYVIICGVAVMMFLRNRKQTPL